MADRPKRDEAVLAVRFFRTPAGAEPVREWLKALPAEVRKEIGGDIFKVQLRWPVGKPLVDGFGGGLYEVRSSFDRSEYRVLFVVEHGCMVLLHGFQKKSRRTPVGELELARRRWKDEEP